MDDAYQELGDWREEDTVAVKTLTDEDLLHQVKFCRMLAGWVLVAEVCKRFERLRSAYLAFVVAGAIVLIAGITGVGLVCK